MDVRILGCSGGIGGARRTTCLAVDSDLLVDAGTGIGDLTLDALGRIDHVFLTHSHLDHILGLPLLADAVDRTGRGPITVHALSDTIDILRQHIFNGRVWPDFSVLPTPQAPVLRWAPLEVGDRVVLGERRITAIPARHTVPAVGYVLDSGRASLVFSGDTTTCPEFWAAVNGLANLRHVIVETSFPDAEQDLAEISRHYHPALLARDLGALRGQPSVHISHLKPGDEDVIWDELRGKIRGADLRLLVRGEVLTL